MNARLIAILAMLALTLPPLSAAAQDDGYHVLPFATGLHAPRGLTIDESGWLVAAIGGSGDGHRDGRVLRLADLDGNMLSEGGREWQDLANNLPTSFFRPGVAFGGNAVFGVSDIQFDANGDVVFVTGAFEADRTLKYWHAVWSTAERYAVVGSLWTAQPYASIWSYEAEHNPDGAFIEANPYALELDDLGNAYVTDAAANTVWLVTPDGAVSLYAVFPTIVNPSGSGPARVQTVPTGIVWGPDGALYVGSETGAPFPVGASSVWRLSDDNGDGDALDEGELTEYATGLTTVTDIAFDNQGRLIANEFRGFLTKQPVESGRVVRWENNDWAVLADGLTTPTGLTVGWDDTIYVSLEYIGQIVQIRR